MNNHLSDALQFFGNPGFMAVKALIEARLASARAELEVASVDKFQIVQGKVKALRELVQDLERSQ